MLAAFIMHSYSHRLYLSPSHAHSLWRVGHGEADKVSTRQRKEDHDDGESGVVGEVDGKVGAGLDVAQHEEGDEDHPADDQHREDTGLFMRLERKRERE